MNLTDENFDQAVKKEGLVLVDFFAEWCSPCSVLGPMLEKIEKDMEKRFTLLKADVNTLPLTSQKFQVDRIPMVILFDKGNAVSGFIGLKSEEEIRQLLENYWYQAFAKKNGYKLDSNSQAVIRGLLANEKKYGKKYCPCRRVTGDKEQDEKIVCPCVYHKDEIKKDGHCFCRLFLK